jgi:hypothetical protein
MSYDPTQQAAQPGGYPQQPYQQPQYQQPQYPPTQQGYQQQGYPPPEPPPAANYTQYNNPQQTPYAAPAAMGAGFDFQGLWKKLGMTGQICAGGGLVLFLSFILPWFSVSSSCSGSFCSNVSNRSSSLSGFQTAGDGVGFGYSLLWLVLIISLALIALPIITALGKFAAQQGQMFILIAAGVAVLCEIVFMFTAFGAAKSAGLGSATFGDTTVNYSSGPGFGFWLGFLATLAAGGVYVYFNYIAKKPMMGMIAQPLAAQQPYQQPGVQYPPQQGQYPPQQGQYPPQQQQQYPGQYPGQQPPYQQ